MQRGVKVAAAEAEHESRPSGGATRPPEKELPPGEKRPKDRIVHAAGLVGLLTLFSRVLGLLRDAVVAASFRKTATDAFIVAFTIPNVLRRLLAEGSLTVAFVAVFTDYRENKGEEASRGLLANTLGALSIVLVVTTAAGMIFARPLVLLFAKGMSSAQLAEATLLTRLMFPFLITVGLVALAMGALNTLRHFAAPAAAPMVLNILIIVTILGASDIMGSVFGLPRIGSWALGVLFGGLGQLLLQLSPLARRHLLVSPRLSLRHEGLRRVGRLMLPSLFGLAIYQINIVLARRFASYLAVGSISYLYYAQRLIEFPIGIFAVAIATVSLPKLSGHASVGEFEAVKETYRYALRLVLFAMLPATAGLLALGEPLAAVLFQRGAFDYEMARQTAWTLSGFSLGLVAAGGVRQTAPVFFALDDTRTPVFASALSLSVYIVSALALYERYATFGLALAVALGSSANFAFLLLFLRRRLGPLGLSRIMGSLLRSAFGALVAGGAALGVARLGVWPLGGAAVRNYAVLALAVLAGAGTYVLSGLLLGSPEIRELRAALRRRRGRS